MSRRRTRRVYDEIHRRCEVKFPEGLSPHPAQVMTMSSIIRALNKKENAMIESPTGTGRLSRCCAGVGVAGKGVEGRVGVEIVPGVGRGTRKVRGGEEEVRGGGEIGETDRGRVRGGMGVERRAFSASAAGEGSTPKIYMCTRTHSRISQIFRRAQAHGVFTEIFRVVVATAHVSDE